MDKSFSIVDIETKEEIEKCWKVVQLLRPHISADSFLSLTSTMISNEGYKIIAVKDKNEVVAYAGYRSLTTLHSGKILYLDDLCTDAAYRNKGLATILLNQVKKKAKSLNKDAVTLDSSYDLTNAHRLYLNQSYKMVAHHFMLKMESKK